MKGKTRYDFILQDPMQAESLIQQFLYANRFLPMHGMPGVYLFNDPIFEGKRGFEYIIRRNQLTIQAYIGSYKKPQPFEGTIGLVVKQRYRNLLSTLFHELSANNIGSMVNSQTMELHTHSGQEKESSIHGPAYVQEYQNPFMEDQRKKKECFAVAGFVISLFLLLLSFFGLAPGLLLALLVYWFAIQGLPTKKRWMSIVSIVLTSISVAITIFWLILSIWI